jgi:hypothetical protein
MTETTVNARAVMRWLMAAFYVIAGVAHLAAPRCVSSNRTGLGADAAR